MKKIFYLIFTLFLFNGSIKAIDTALVRYMPLNIGNVYVYHWSAGITPQFQGNYRVKFTKDSIAFGKRYFVDEGQADNNFGVGNPYISRCMRYDSIKGNLIGLQNGSECLIDSLASKKYDTEYCCSNRKVYCNDTGMVTLFSNYQTAKKSFFTNGLSGFGEGYAKNIGMYSAGRGEMGPFYDLKGCVINGVLHGDTSFITGIMPISTSIPSEFQLYQNYPNPFNPSTKIKFDIPSLKSPLYERGVGLPAVRSQAGGFIILKIYDLLGREVATLVNEQLIPGTYEVEWDGSKYPSGVYFYTLKAGSFSQTQKMVLLK